ncbi:hypothetical protein TEA_020157 [Camellia sinensis var. sinensis]|uniref:Uncharacterized protein n=1 Tax=Camellia sinensis var. sinensis TaxID=542762 RepID=A0A4S4DHB4_CAMSN|nr:hypothetical protein TEA_020157 [Camellia sinensis var. sinensis]
MTMPVLENVVETLFSKDFHLLQALNVADLGCATSSNTFTVISTIKRMMEKKCRELNCQTLELQVYLNDLPGNDFNSLFKGLLSKVVVGNKCKEVSCYVMGVPGSLHGRLFPRNSLHLVHSCYSAHWLSQVVPNGCMVLILPGRQSSDPSSMESCFTWELLAIAIAELVSQGLINEDKLDTFNVPRYFPSLEEVKDIVEGDGSFTIDHMEGFELDTLQMQENDKWVRGEKLAKAIRAFTEPIISN